MLPSLVTAMELHGHLDLEPSVRKRVLTASAATIDRLLAPVREKAGSTRRRQRSKKKLSKMIPTRTFADWEAPTPGSLEIDFVAHCGGSMAGTFIHSLVATDVGSGWTEAVPLLAREQSLVVEALAVIRRQMPVPVVSINSDNDSAFISETLFSFCKEQQIEFTRSRAYRKNDQAWIEQKNGAVIRRFVGHDRFTGVVAGQALASLFHVLRLYVNYFQPSFKLREKTRVGGKVKKFYFKPATPRDRLLQHADVEQAAKDALRDGFEHFDPVALLHKIREGQSALVALGNPDQVDGPGRGDLEQFLAQLPRLWESGEARPTHREVARARRHWRTREDPFERVWPDILLWLQESPEATAKSLFGRLQQEQPRQFPDGQLRTLQRRIRQWRRIMARKLVFGSLNEGDAEDEAVAVGTKETNELAMS